MSRAWRILFLQIELSGGLKALQDKDVNILEVAELFECRQIIDTETGLRHPVNITINKAREIKFPERVYHYNRISLFLFKRDIFRSK